MPSDERKAGLGALFLLRGAAGGAKPSFLQFLPDLRHFRRRGVFQGSRTDSRYWMSERALAICSSLHFCAAFSLLYFLKKRWAFSEGTDGVPGNGDRGASGS